jgi:hypothetical protein
MVRGEQRKVRREKQFAAEIAQDPAVGGGAVALVGLGDLRKAL